MRVQYLYWRNSHILVTQQPPSKFMYGYMPHPRRFKAVPFKAHGKTYTRFSGLEYFYQIFISGSFLSGIFQHPQLQIFSRYRVFQFIYKRQAQFFVFYPSYIGKYIHQTFFCQAIMIAFHRFREEGELLYL